MKEKNGLQILTIFLAKNEEKPQDTKNSSLQKKSNKQWLYIIL